MSNSIKTTIERFYGRFFVLFLFGSLILACEQRTELIDQPVYDGPTITMDSVYTKMSDSARIVMILSAPKQNDFENDDREWPKGMYLEYLDKLGNVESTFKADYVYYTAEDNLYKGQGNVVVVNKETGDELTTEELFWSPDDEQFYTDRFVTIVSDDEVHTGDGLVADEDFETYKITRPSGTMSLEEDETD